MNTNQQFDSIGSAAEYLDVTEKTVRNYIARGLLPAYRLGTRSVRIKREDLDKMLTPIPTA